MEGMVIRVRILYTRDYMMPGKCSLIKAAAKGLLPDAYNRGLRMRRECRERYRRHRGLTIPTCITAHASRTCRDACWDRFVVVSFEVGRGENVPSIPGACATRNFVYLVRGPWKKLCHYPRIPIKSYYNLKIDIIRVLIQLLSAHICCKLNILYTWNRNILFITFCASFTIFVAYQHFTNCMLTFLHLFILRMGMFPMACSHGYVIQYGRRCKMWSSMLIAWTYWLRWEVYF